MKKIIPCSVLIFTLAVETSCGGRFQNTAGGGAVSGESHRLNLKKGTDKVISKRKYGYVYCTDEGLFAYKYDIMDEIDTGDEYGEDILYYMNFDGGNEKKIGAY